jgi:hypothetical protein
MGYRPIECNNRLRQISKTFPLLAFSLMQQQASRSSSAIIRLRQEQQRRRQPIGAAFRGARHASRVSAAPRGGSTPCG